MTILRGLLLFFCITVIFAAPANAVVSADFSPATITIIDPTKAAAAAAPQNSGTLNSTLSSSAVNVSVEKAAAAAAPQNSGTLNSTLSSSAVLAIKYRDINQGDVVYWGENVSVERVIGWYNTIAYWNATQIPGVVPPNTIISLKHPNRLFIDPNQYPVGNYYKWSGMWERAGNNLAFIVKKRPALNKTSESPPLTSAPTTWLTVKTRPTLEARHVADYLIARGDPLNIPINATNVWGFSNRNFFYKNLQGTLTLSATESAALGEDTYTLLSHTGGPNTVIEIKYDSPSNAIWFNNVSTFELKKTPLAGYVPAHIHEIFSDYLKTCDDEIAVQTMIIQEPTIDIKNIWDEDTEQIAVNGYTNAKEGTPISLYLDEIRVITKNGGGHVMAHAKGSDPGAYRTWDVMIPIDFNETAPGQHQITAVLPTGQRQSVSFYVYSLPEGQKRPQGYVRYIGGNEWVPTPTPVVEYVNVPLKFAPLEVTPLEVTPLEVTPPQQYYLNIVDAVIVRGVDLLIVLLEILAGLYVSTILYRAIRQYIRGDK
jgi:hypothetical protein